MSAAHRIRRLEWRARAASPAEGFAIRAQLRRFVDTDLLPEIERAFDAVTGDDVIHVPRLELTIAVSKVEEIAAALNDGIREQSRAFERHRVRSVGRPPDDGSAPEPNVVALRPRQPDLGLEAVRRYLETGLLPWYVANQGRKDTQSILVRFARDHIDALIAAVPLAPSRARAFMFRWLQLVAEPEWINIARRIETASGTPVDGLGDFVATLVTTSPSTLPAARRLPLLAVLLALGHARGQGKEVSRNEVGEMLVHAAAPPHGARQRFSELPPSVTAWIARLTSERSLRPAGQVEEPADAPGTEGEPRQARSEPGRFSSSLTEKDAEVQPDASGLAVDHAGLVLIHPFLPRLFEVTGITVKGATDLADLPRAAALLSYAARGDDVPVDFESGLIKVLLGLRPDSELLVPPGWLNAADREEVDSLLQSLIEHWRVLKHTSIAGAARVVPAAARTARRRSTGAGACAWSPSRSTCCSSNCPGVLASSNCHG